MRTSCSPRAPTRSRSTRRRSSGRARHRARRRLGSQAVVVAIDAEGGRVRSRAGTTETPRGGRVGARGAGARRGRDPADVDRRRRDARRLRPGAHRRCRRRGDVPVIASGGAGDARHVAEALGVAQAALLASILHEDPERLDVAARASCARSGSRSVTQPETDGRRSSRTRRRAAC